MESTNNKCFLSENVLLVSIFLVLFIIILQFKSNCQFDVAMKLVSYGIMPGL